MTWVEAWKLPVIVPEGIRRGLASRRLSHEIRWWEECKPSLSGFTSSFRLRWCPWYILPQGESSTSAGSRTAGSMGPASSGLVAESSQSVEPSPFPAPPTISTASQSNSSTIHSLLWEDLKWFSFSLTESKLTNAYLLPQQSWPSVIHTDSSKQLQSYSLTHILNWKARPVGKNYTVVTFKKVLSRMSDGSACKHVSLEVLGPQFDPQNPRGNIKSQVQWHTLINPSTGEAEKGGSWGLVGLPVWLSWWTSSQRDILFKKTEGFWLLEGTLLTQMRKVCLSCMYMYTQNYMYCRLFSGK